MINALRNPLIRRESGRCSNKALAFHRLSPAMDEPEGKEHDQKDKMLEAMCENFQSGSLDPYRHALENWRAVEKSDDPLEFFEMTTASRLICGMGNKNVHECGATFLHPWGVPVIPGSAVKGVATSFAATAGGDAWQKSVATPFRAGGPSALLVFGGMDSDKKSFAAGLDIMDAWWVPGDKDNKSPFEQDILTPHNKDYQTKEKGSFPDGTESPVPVKFLTIRAGEKFLFALRGPEALREVVKQIIRAALSPEGPGLGSKTRLGYGRFNASQSTREKERVQAVKANADLVELRDGLKNGTMDNEAAKKFVAKKKLAEGLDKSSDIVREIYAIVIEKWPEKANATEGWHTKFR